MCNKLHELSPHFPELIDMQTSLCWLTRRLHFITQTKCKKNTIDFKTAQKKTQKEQYSLTEID